MVRGHLMADKIAVVAIAVGVVMCIGICACIPVLIGRGAFDALLSPSEAHDSAASDAMQDVRAQDEKAMQFVRFVEEHSQESRVSDIYARIYDDIDRVSVRLERLTITQTSATIAGSASTRDMLLKAQDSVRHAEGVVKVDLPYSYLSGTPTGFPFVMTVTLALPVSRITP